MTSREQRFLAELPLIQRVIRSVCARRYLRGADAEDFGSVVMTRFIENDYEVLFKFQGRASLKTYLGVVINRIYIDFQTHRFGKWRNSADARRLGPTAERLECLLYRDGLTFSEACGVLASDTRVRESQRTLDDLRSRLPPRISRREREAIVETRVRQASFEADHGERQALAERTFAAIERSLMALPARDRLFLRLHFACGLSLAEIGRSLGYGPKAPYPIMEKILKGLRSDLERQGIEARDAMHLLSVLDWDAACLTEDPEGEPPGSEAAESSPSTLETETSRQKGEA